MHWIFTSSLYELLILQRSKKIETIIAMIVSDMRFVKNFTPPDFQAKDFTPLISLNFNSFSDKNTKNECFWRNLHHWQKNLHCRRQWQISPLTKEHGGSESYLRFFRFMTAFRSDTKLADEHTIDFYGKLLRAFLARIGIISRPQSRFITGGDNRLWYKAHCTGWLLRQIVAQLPRVHSGGRLHQGQDIDNSARWLKNMYDDNEKKYFLRSWGVPTQIWKVKNSFSNTTSRYKNKDWEVLRRKHKRFLRQ